MHEILTELEQGKGLEKKGNEVVWKGGSAGWNRKGEDGQEEGDMDAWKGARTGDVPQMCP